MEPSPDSRKSSAADKLRRFIELGGFLLIDDAGSDAFDASIRRALARAFPSRPLRPLPSDHVIYHSFYLIDRPVGRVLGPDHKGIFARTRIPAGTLLGFFDGRAAVADLGEDGRGAQLDDFFWRQSVHLRRTGNTLLYLIPTEEPDGVDYLNHSCRPNARVEDQLYVHALRDIEPGEEITADYRTFNLVSQEIPCWCDEPKCVI